MTDYWGECMMESKSNKKEERTLKTYLTYQELKDMEACEEALLSFRAIFGKKATVKRVVHRLQNPGKRDEYAKDYENWLNWLMSETPKLTIALLKAGVDVDVADNDGWTPLHWTVHKKNIEMAEFLLEQGADVNTADKGGWTPLDLARNDEYTEMVNFLKSKGGK